jgi:uncharacterized protein
MATALITGGTSGIGAAFARQLAARGWDLVLVARNEARLDAMRDELHAVSGIHVETLVADLAERVNVARVAARIENPDRPLDMVINNAGISLGAPLSAASTAQHDEAFEVMCRAVLVLGGAAARSMRGRGGRIINISSLQTYLATGSYGAIKSWVTSYSESLSVELRGTGITVTAVLPGWVRTEWHERPGAHRRSLPGFLWIEPETVARTALRDAERSRVISIPTLRYRALGWCARHAPRAAIRWVSSKISSGKSGAIHPIDGSEHPGVKAENQ